MRILWVKAGGLVPLDTGGKIRSYHILKELASRHEITLFTFHDAHGDDIHRDLERLFARVVLVPLSLPAPRSRQECAEYARNSSPLGLTTWPSTAAQPSLTSS